MMIFKNYWPLILFNLIYVTAFAVYYLSVSNYEFLWYVGVLVFFLALILATLAKTKFDRTILWGLSIWGLLHMAGGGVQVGAGVLYQWPIIHLAGEGDSLILKFDQFVHFFGFGVATLLFYHLLKAYLNPNVGSINWKVMYPLIVVGGMGLGALNEIIEFAAVVALSQTGVGGYYNTSLDLVFNTLGAIAAAIWIHCTRVPKSIVQD
ncbi:MAG: DUF2238 domain-containing protein [Patescibacteria group bacterium]